MPANIIKSLRETFCVNLNLLKHTGHALCYNTYKLIKIYSCLMGRMGEHGTNTPRSRVQSRMHRLITDFGLYVAWIKVFANCKHVNCSSPCLCSYTQISPPYKHIPWTNIELVLFTYSTPEWLQYKCASYPDLISVQMYMMLKTVYE